MTNVLEMTAAKLGHPVLFVVQMKTHDRLSHVGDRRELGVLIDSNPVTA
jgi:hypothetical protein